MVAKCKPLIGLSELEIGGVGGVGGVGGSGRKFACTFFIHDAMPPSLFGPVGPP